MELKKDFQKYLNCMEEIKMRTSVIISFLNGERTTGYFISDIESLCLQFRKILELIALASMAANKDEYKKHHKKFYNHWRAKEILTQIEKINPNFYPVPSEQVLNPNGTVVEVKNITEGFLTKDEFVDIYQTCSGVIHANNPYKKEKDLNEIYPQLGGWLNKIIRLLNHHQIQLLDSKKQLWVIMNNKEDGKAWAFEMELQE